MNTDLKLLPPGEKKAAARVLGQQGYSTREIEHLLGMDHNTAWRALQTLTEPELRQFETDFKAMIEAKKREGLMKGYNRLVELIPKERRIDQLVKGLDKLEGVNNGTNVAIQNNGGGMNIEFS